jgi:serine/threonine-protein kinase
VIVNRGDDEIGLAHDRVWSDATAFDQLIRAGAPAQAMELYTGELLPGFIIDEAPDFERWLDEERARRASEAARASLELASSAQQAGNLRLAIQWIRRAISIEPFSEPAHQRLIEVLDQSGDRAAALRAYDDLRALLRTEFEAEPAAETVELIQSVREGATGRSRSRRVDPASVMSASEVPGQRRRSARLAFAAGSGVLIIAALLWGVFATRAPKPYRPPANHVAVLYFNDQSANKDLAYLAEGLTSELIDQLGQVKQLQVISQNGVRPFRGESIPLDSIARALDVGTLVGGSVTSSNDRLRVTVQLIDGSSGVVMHSRKLERPNGELFALLDDVSSEVARFLRFTLGSEIRVREWRSETRSLEAWQLSSRAEYLRNAADDAENSGDIASAINNLELADSLLARATQLDRNWAAPLVLRGRIAELRAYMSTVIDRPPRSAEWIGLARDFAGRALRVDNRSHEAHELRGSVNLSQWLLTVDVPVDADSLLRNAERDLSAALAIRPELPRAQSRLSAVLFIQGRYAEARRAALRALEADAYLTDADEIVNRLFYTSFEIGDDEEAGYWCDEVRRRNPNRWPAAYCDLILLAWSSAGSPDPRKALHLLEEAGADDPPAMKAVMQPQLTMLAAAVLARAGEADGARDLLRQARAKAPEDPELLHLEAAVRVILREEDRARELLQELFRSKPATQARISGSRMFRSLRENPISRSDRESESYGQIITPFRT